MLFSPLREGRFKGILSATSTSNNLPIMPMPEISNQVRFLGAGGFWIFGAGRATYNIYLVQQYIYNSSIYIIYIQHLEPITTNGWLWRRYVFVYVWSLFWRFTFTKKKKRHRRPVAVLSRRAASGEYTWSPATHCPQQQQQQEWGRQPVRLQHDEAIQVVMI